MSGEDPLIHCLDRLHLKDDQQLQARAEYFQRQLSVNVPPKIFDKGPNSRTVAAIHLAFENLSRHGWDNGLAAQLSGCSKRAYENIISVVRKTLQLQPNVTFESLGVTFGCTTMIPHVQKLWESFSTDYVAKLNMAQKQTAQQELDQPAWKGAAFYTCAKAFGERIAKGKLQEMCSANTTEFNKYLKVIAEICAKEIKDLKSSSATSTRSRRKRGEDNEKSEDEEQVEKEQEVPKKRGRGRPPKDAAPPKKRGRPSKKDNAVVVLPPSEEEKKMAPISGIVSMINRQDYKDTKRYKDYVEWSQNLRARLA